MKCEANLYKNLDSGAFAVSISGKFKRNDTQLVCEDVNPVSATRLKSILWCINTVGYIELEWQTAGENIPICVLSGNGKWDFSRENEIPVPAGSTGKLLISTKGFDVLDSFTIIVSGAK